MGCYNLVRHSRPAWLDIFVDYTHTHSMNNLRWQPHWLPDWRHFRESHVTDGVPETAVSASLQKIKSIKNQQLFFLSFSFIKSQTCDSFVNHFDGRFAYLKILDGFSFKMLPYFWSTCIFFWSDFCVFSDCKTLCLPSCLLSWLKLWSSVLVQNLSLTDKELARLTQNESGRLGAMTHSVTVRWARHYTTLACV